MITIKDCSLINGNGKIEEDVFILIEDKKIKRIDSLEEKRKILRDKKNIEYVIKEERIV